MSRVPVLSILVAAVLLVPLAGSAAPGATGSIPDPSLSQVPDVVTTTPDGSFEVTARIVNVAGPVAGVDVDLHFSDEATALLAWIDPVPATADVPVHLETTPGEPYRDYRQVSDADGFVHFHIAAGGCVRFQDLQSAPYVIQVRAAGVLLAECDVNSPDVVNAQGQLATDLGHSICLDGNTGVGLADASYHATAITQALVQRCSKFTAPYDGPVGLADTVILADYVIDGTAGSCN